MALLGQGDVFGDAKWRENKVAKSTVHVRALTYCDIHIIQVDKLKEVLQFYKAFAHTFTRNLTLTYDLSKRTAFYKVAEAQLQKIFKAAEQHQPPFTQAQVLLSNTTTSSASSSPTSTATLAKSVTAAALVVHSEHCRV